MPNTTDPYAPLAAELDQVLAEHNPQRAAAGLRRCQLALARVATGAAFDRARHKAISGAIAAAMRGSGPAGPSDSAPAALTTRTA